MTRWRLLGMRAMQRLVDDSTDHAHDDEIDWRRRRRMVVVVAVAIAALFLALQLTIEAQVRDQDLPESCAMRGQPCHTTTTLGPRAAP